LIGDNSTEKYIYCSQWHDSAYYFNIELYKKRIAIGIETFFVDANDRAQSLGKQVIIIIIIIRLLLLLDYYHSLSLF
jgi:hypothetical protein